VKVMAKTRVLKARHQGFSLVELMITMVILLAVVGVVMSAMMQMMTTQGTISNRTEMHSSIRSATETLQQEIGQAGRIAQFSTPVTLSTAVAIGTASPTLTCSGGSCAANIFVGEQLVVGAGAFGTGLQNPETVTVTAVNTTTSQITAVFNFAHAIGSPVVIAGAFASGIISDIAATNPSTGSLLKMYGDINGDGTMVYVEYNCDTTNGRLTRSVTPITSTTKNTAQVILPNVTVNPGNAPCFVYQSKTIGTDVYVVDVSVTLSVQTQNLDPQTHVKQTETKALLNVSPRNVFDVWLLASGSVITRIQPMPANIVTLSQ
jgi:type II secretory pathway pseudopilin PulG